MTIKLNKLSFKLDLFRTIYLLIFASFGLYLITDMQYNTAFVDEAIYATVGEGVLRGLFWENALSWMGGSYLYPVISASINRYYGLEGIRIFSLFCLMVAGFVSGRIANQLGGKWAEIITLILFLFSSIVLDLGQFGTYDAPALLFLSLSVYFVIQARYKKSHKRLLYVLVSAILMSLAIFSKYFALFFIPAMVMLIVFRGARWNNIWQNYFSGLITSIGWLSIVFGSFLFFFIKNKDALMNFFTGDNFQEPATYGQIIEQIAYSLNIFLIVIPLAIIVGFKILRGEKLWLVFILSTAGAIPLAYHLSALNMRSIHKHLVYSLVFWAPLAGWLLNKIRHKWTKVYSTNAFMNNVSQIGWTIVLIVMVTNFWIGFSKHWKFQRSWPSATKVLEFLRENRKADDKILAEASSVYKFHLFDGFEDPASWSSTWYLEYEGMYGTDAMNAAISNKEFDYIILNNYFTSGINNAISYSIDQNYEVVLEDTYVIEGAFDQVTRVWAPKNDQVATLVFEAEEVKD